MEKTPLMEMQGITKRFPGVTALDGVSFDLYAGEIHCLIGENGAGKSTLIKCLGGVNIPEEGKILINGEDAKIVGPVSAVEAGIGVIYQEFNLVPGLSVAENIFLNREFRKGPKIGKRQIMIDRPKLYEEANKVLESIGFHRPNSKLLARQFTISQQQMVEIGKSTSNNCKIMVFDEPTAVLTENETRNLFDVIKNLRDSGVGIIYISHRLDEITELANRVTVLRDGKVVTTVPNDESLTKEKMAELMVGRELGDYYPERHDTVTDEVILKVEGLTHERGLFKDISFELHKGEILGFSGLVGAGRTETMKAIYGAMPFESGTITLFGDVIKKPLPKTMVQHGMCLLPEDRKSEGLALGMTIGKNIMIANYETIAPKGFVSAKVEKEFIKEQMDKLLVNPRDPSRLAVNLSGGNQQKVILAKWLARQPKILIMDEPTRGIDVNAKSEIYRIMNDLTLQGMTIIMVSSEMPELIGCCDRILVMYEGQLVGEFKRGADNFTEQAIGHAQAGATVA